MAAFRRVVIALGVLAAFAGLASAQMSCTPNSGSGQALVRSEGKAELIGDLVLFCTGGTALTQGAAAPTVNITITLPQAVTSKVLTAATSTFGALTDALLVMDDAVINPLVGGGTVGGLLCSQNAVTSTCPTFAQNSPGGGQVPTGVANSPQASSPPANVYQGVTASATPNSITFYQVPVVPPGTTGQRTFRITNLRQNVSAGSTGVIVANVGAVNSSGSGTQQVTFTSSTVTLGNVQPSLTVKASPYAIANCNALSYAFAGTISFTQAAGFSNAFKTRQLPTALANSGQGAGGASQIGAINTGGTLSESGYEFSIGGVIAGQADYGTRMKAIFANIPSGGRLFVSFANVTGASGSVGLVGNVSNTWNTALVGTNASTGALAELLLAGAESFPDTTSAPVVTANFLTGGQLLGVTSPGIPSTTFPFFELPVSGGAATAVWEVLNTSSNASFTFDLFLILPAQGTTGNGVANLSYAPTVTTPSVPAFVDPNAASPQTATTITQCRTILLFPYVTSFGGFDTGVAIANTTSDVFGTAAQTGGCTATLYGDPAPAPTVPAAAWSVNGGTPSASIASGHTGAFAISQYAPGFTGYMIAVCNFQYAHGFAFVADWGNPNYSSAMGYLALILPSTTTRGTSGTTGVVGAFTGFNNVEVLQQ